MQFRQCWIYWSLYMFREVQMWIGKNFLLPKKIPSDRGYLPLSSAPVFFEVPSADRMRRDQESHCYVLCPYNQNTGYYFRVI